MEGKLMISERRNFQKVFDLTERILPSSVDTSFPSDSDMARYLIQSYLTAQGIGLESEMTYLRKKHKKAVAQEIHNMLKEQLLVEVMIQGIEDTYYALPIIHESLNSRIRKKKLHIMSPFDGTVIQRKRLEQLFGFSYQIECYVPQAKRVHGYFCLPILWGDTFIGRVDCKVDRKAKKFLIQHLWLESSDKVINSSLQTLIAKLKKFAAFHQCHEILLLHCSSSKYQEEVSLQLSKQ